MDRDRLMPLTAHDILIDADAFRRCYPGWPLSSLQLTDYTDDPEFAILSRDRDDDEEGDR
jgi:hypothetical protein